MANRLRAWVGWVPPSGGGAGGWVSGWSSAALATTFSRSPRFAWHTQPRLSAGRDLGRNRAGAWLRGRRLRPASGE